MKKTRLGILVIMIIILFTACGKGTRPVSVGNLSFNYDSKVWEVIKKSDDNAPLEFKDSNNNTISINVTKESTYQHPMTMITFIKDLLSESDGFEVFLEPKEITVNDTTWYEFGYLYSTDFTTYKVYQRYYGKYYNAASVSYTSTLENYDEGIEEAIKLMSDIIVKEEDNQENEEKAKQFLVGEWDLNGKGYLILSEDGSYQWFSDSNKDKNNMHYGTYGCDVQNDNMNMYEGDGIYLVLFPESLVINGESTTSLQYKNDYIISLEKDETDGYPMVNISTYTLYTLTKQ